MAGPAEGSVSECGCAAGSLGSLGVRLPLGQEKVGASPKLFELSQGCGALIGADRPHDLFSREDRVLQGRFVDVAPARPLLTQKRSAGITEGLESLVAIHGDAKNQRHSRALPVKGVRLRYGGRDPSRDLDEANFRHVRL